jgi:hypothetical protein
MRVMRRGGAAASRPIERTDADEWVDRQIESLRHAIEQPDPRPTRRPQPVQAVNGTPAAATRSGEAGGFGARSALGRSVREHRFDLLVYGLCIVSAAAAGWLIASAAAN